jgi:hypothetical protein
MRATIQGIYFNTTLTAAYQKEATLLAWHEMKFLTEYTNVHFQLQKILKSMFDVSLIQSIRAVLVCLQRYANASAVC